MSPIFPTLPLNAFVTETFLNHNLKFSDKTILVAVQHLLYDTLDMYKAVIALGVPAGQIFTMGKCYSNIPAAIQEMEEIGIQVVSTTQPGLGEFYPQFKRDITQLWKRVNSFLKHTDIERIVVLDDGGMLITTIPPSLAKRYTVCGEEQTTSGLYLFEKKPPAFDVVSEASSAVKLLIESPVFTKAAAERVMERTQEQMMFDGKKVGIIGMGSIGTSLAVYLHDLGAEVYGFDVTPKKAYTLPDRVTVKSASSLREILSECEYCFGCTGRDIFEDFELPMPHNPHLTLISVSSGDKEFLSLINCIKERKHSFDPVTKDVIYTSKYGTITILQQGFPINFDGKQGSASPEITQLTTAMLLSGLMQTYLRCNTEQEQTNYSAILMHSPTVQKRLLEEWLALLPAMKEMYTADVLEGCRQLEWYVENSGGLRATDSAITKIF